MAYTVAFAGKGGTGKTTIAAITVKYILERTKKPVLAVDADSNACLNEALGVDIHTTIGKLREESLATIRSGGSRPGGMNMEQLFDYQIQQAIIEARGFDMIVMGRPEGPGCYCAANNIIRKYTDKLSDTYSYVVLDNEAGMEHLSRRTTHAVDMLFIISDPTLKGIKTAGRIVRLVNELSLDIAKSTLIVNRVHGEEEGQLRSIAGDEGLEIGGIVPDDESVFDNDLHGRSVFEIGDSSLSLKSIYEILDSAIGLQ